MMIQVGGGSKNAEYPAWFSVYLNRLQVQDDNTVKIEQLENAPLDKKPQKDQFECLHTEFDCPYEIFLWSSIDAEQTKLVSKLNDTLTPLGFSTKSLKFWLQHFQIVNSWRIELRNSQ